MTINNPGGIVAPPRGNMKAKIAMKMLAAVLLLLIVALVGNSVDAAFWISARLPRIIPATAALETIHIAKFDSRQSAPLALGAIESPENAYLRLKLRFRVDGTDGYPNMFQTAPENGGVRLEIAGTTAAIVVRDLAENGKLRGMTLTTSLKTGQWYTLEVEALNKAFIRVTLDGHPVASFVGQSLSLAMSQIMVGGGFDSSRPFQGQIEDISIIKGNLPELAHRGLMVFYIFILLLTVIFCCAIWKLLGEHPAVQRIVGKLLLLGFPLILILGYLEYRLTFINTNYYAKRVFLEQQIGDIEVLVTGSSNTFYGVAPEVFRGKGFNLAFPGNGMYFDAKLIEKYQKRMPNLRMVVLTVNYYTMGADHTSAGLLWRQYFLRQYFGTPTEVAKGYPLDWGFWLEPMNFSRIALYGAETKAYIDAKFMAPVDIIASPSGWFNGGDVPGDPSMGLGGVAAAAHNGGTSTVNYDRNLREWEALVPLLQAKNIGVAMVLLPTDASYYSQLDKSKIELMNRKLSDFSSKHHIKLTDYTGDPRFSLADFTWEMPDHLNARGAKKISKIIDQDLIAPY